MSYNILSNGTNVSNYIKWLEEYTNKTKEELLMAEKCTEKDSVFLSIITRTQGKRPEALAETLLCLTAQTDMDFELLIMGHNLNDAQYDLVMNIIDAQPQELKQRIRFIPVNGGTRTTPLNEGFDNANGSYIAILDDDDIVLDNWVEEFKKSAEKAPGAVLHAFAFAQKWMTVQIDSDVDALRAVAAHTTEFCKEFDWIGEINLNICPPVGLAFPKYSFKELGIRFDETLNTTEDWDFLMRTAFVTGVTDIVEPTCIYRLWQNAENSQTLHSPEEWKRNHFAIINKFHEIPLLLPIGYTKKLVWSTPENEETEESPDNNVVFENVNKKVSRIYFDNGNGFNNTDSDAIEFEADGRFDVSIKLNSNAFSSRYFRWDPMDEGDFNISELSIDVVSEDGTVKHIDNSSIVSNGVNKNSKFIFIFSDPQIIFKTPCNIIEIKISGKINDNTDSEYLMVTKKNKNMKLIISKLKQKFIKK